MATYGASSQKLTATAFWARCSAVSDSVRDPVNRQTTMTLASALDGTAQRPADQGDGARAVSGDQTERRPRPSSRPATPRPASARTGPPVATRCRLPFSGCCAAAVVAAAVVATAACGQELDWAAWPQARAFPGPAYAHR